MRHINIPVFIPHLGCPNQCVFCNQRTISGVEKFDPLCVRDTIEQSLSTAQKDDFVEIAFFGGSFTGIDRSLMIQLLEIAYTYVLSGRVKSIRCSTRPDYISDEIISILKRYGVNVVELGLQTTSDSVLKLTKRNHTFQDEVNACQMITDAGITLVGQMMIGLPSSTLKDELETAEFIINHGCTAARVYPTVVFHGTELSEMTKDGRYSPLSLEDAVERSAAVVKKLRWGGVEVIRIGLCSSDNLSSPHSFVAGPNHPALGELVENKIYYDKILNISEQLTLDRNSVLEIYVSFGCLSKAVGQNKRNKFLLIKALGIKDAVFSESNDVFDGDALVVKRKENKCT